METQWYNIEFKCTECESKTHLQKAIFSADGELCFTFYCGKCKEQRQWRVYASRLQHKALLSDMKRDPSTRRRGRKITPVEAKSPTPPQKAELTEKDKEFLRKLKIDPLGRKNE